jgi:hypothetical protein
MKKIRVKVDGENILRADGDYTKTKWQGYTDLRYFYAFPDDFQILYGEGKTIRGLLGGGRPISGNKDVREVSNAFYFKRKGYAVNGTFFENGKPFGVIYYDGKLLNPTSSLGKWSDFMVTKDHKAKISQFDTNSYSEILYSISGTPKLLEGGKSVVKEYSSKDNTSSAIISGERPRTALGITKDNLILVIVVDGDSQWDKGLTLEELATVMKYLGAVDAINFDGGGSSSMVEMERGRFQKYTIEEYIKYLDDYNFTRKITEVHMHHTWKPTKASFSGERTIEGMWRYHTGTNKWDDIAQHISIDPEGYIWSGRDLNKAPISSKGYNGTNQAGPFMFEMIGDFDTGREKLEGKQLDTVIQTIRYLNKRFNAPLKFHNEMSTKTCPGNGVNKEEILKMVTQKEEPKSQTEPKDRSLVNKYYIAGYDWAVREGITDGSAPKEPLTTERFLQLLYNYHNRFGGKQ